MSKLVDCSVTSMEYYYVFGLWVVYSDVSMLCGGWLDGLMG